MKNLIYCKQEIGKSKIDILKENELYDLIIQSYEYNSKTKSFEDFKTDEEFYSYDEILLDKIQSLIDSESKIRCGDFEVWALNLENKKWGSLSQAEIEFLFYYFNYNVVDFNGNNINKGAGILDFEFGLSIPCLIEIDAIFVEDEEIFYNPIA